MSTDLSPLSAQRMPPVAPLAANVPAQEVKKAEQSLPGAKPEPAREASMPKERVRENIKEAADNLNQQMRIRGRKLSFEIDDVTNQIVVTVKDTTTGDVIRQIPSEALLRVAHNIEQIKGLLHNELT